MCCISASFNKDTLIELVKAGAYRGGHSFSFTAIDSDYIIKKMFKSFGDFNDLIEVIKESIVDDCYMIVHQQSPTTQERSINSIHPSSLNNTFLWHNGILKSKFIRKMSQDIGVEFKWDTKLLHKLINESIDNINNVEGSFACVYFNGMSQLSCFRNIITPLFFNDKLDLSSVKIDGMKNIPYNTFIVIDVKNCIMINSLQFTSKENPYNI